MRDEDRIYLLFAISSHVRGGYRRGNYLSLVGIKLPLRANGGQFASLQVWRCGTNRVSGDMFCSLCHSSSASSNESPRSCKLVSIVGSILAASTRFLSTEEGTRVQQSTRRDGNLCFTRDANIVSLLPKRGQISSCKLYCGHGIIYVAFPKATDARSTFTRPKPEPALGEGQPF